MNWIITVPKTIQWSDYEKELEAVRDFGQVMNYRLPFLPKEMSIGDRCYVTWNGKVRGWMLITGIKKSDGFICTTTYKQWPEGFYMERSGPFHKVPETPFPGFRGIRKFTENGN